MKTITHYNEETIKSRYYFEKKLILEVTDSATEAAAGDSVNIGGQKYIVTDVTFYPELLIYDYDLIATKNELKRDEV